MKALPKVTSCLVTEPRPQPRVPEPHPSLDLLPGQTDPELQP